MSDDVQEAVLGPMLQLFPPPKHLRQPSAIQIALVPYRRALERFDRPALDFAWQKAVEENAMWCWPTVHALVSQAEAYQRQHQASEAWVEKAQELTDAYTRRFMATSQTAARAKAEGWADKLSAYVTEGAWLQAQILVGRENLSYSGLLVAHLPTIEEKKEAVAELLERARVQARKGHIQVRVPAGLTERWRKAAGQGRER